MDNDSSADFPPTPTLLRFLSKIFGVETFTVTIRSVSSGTSVQLKRSIPATVYNVLITTITAGIGALIIYYVIQKSTFDLFVIFVTVGILVLYVTCLINLFISNTNCMNIQKIICLWLDVDRFLHENSSENYSKISTCFSFLVTNVLIYIFLFFGTITLQYFNFIDWIHFTVGLFELWVHFITLTLTAKCINYILHTRQRLRLLNIYFLKTEILQDKTTSDDHLNPPICTIEACNTHCCNNTHNLIMQCTDVTQAQHRETVEIPAQNILESKLFEMRTQFKKLCDAFCLVDNIFGASVLFLHLNSFIIITVTIFWALNTKNITPIDFRPVLTLIIATLVTVLYSSQIISIVWFCKTTRDELTSTRNIIQDLLLESELGEDIVEQLELFQYQIRGEDLSFSACGFFKIEEPLLCSIAAAVMSYILVLFQISLS